MPPCPLVYADGQTGNVSKGLVADRAKSSPIGPVKTVLQHGTGNQVCLHCGLFQYRAEGLPLNPSLVIYANVGGQKPGTSGLRCFMP